MEIFDNVDRKISPLNRAVLDEIYEISGHANGANGTPEDRTFFLPEVECGVNFVAIAGQSSQDVDPLLGKLCFCVLFVNCFQNPEASIIICWG